MKERMHDMLKWGLSAASTGAAVLVVAVLESAAI